ncbi:MAG: hypothetical protein LBR08_03375 [Bacteroidales bacterium]|nr:hypothetical protein [Bacteroidales bacterium]
MIQRTITISIAARGLLYSARFDFVHRRGCSKAPPADADTASCTPSPARDDTLLTPFDVSSRYAERRVSTTTVGAGLAPALNTGAQADIIKPCRDLLRPPHRYVQW